jgi:hypothetical protein
MAMEQKSLLIKASLLAVTIASLILGIYSFAAAHCDTLDGPVIQDARKALDTDDVTPVLKWVKPKDEKVVRMAFAKAKNAKGKKNEEAAKNQFFSTLVKIHRAGEGASFVGLKPAGATEAVISEADKSLTSGSADALVKLVTDDVAAGITKRFERAAATYQHKDESVDQGREFVEAYVEYTHYVEKLHEDAKGMGAHGQHQAGPKHPATPGTPAHQQGH